MKRHKELNEEKLQSAGTVRHNAFVFNLPTCQITDFFKGKPPWAAAFATIHNEG